MWAPNGLTNTPENVRESLNDVFGQGDEENNIYDRMKVVEP